MIIELGGLLFFFFSSRRRHTRYWRDWSSDVCSSDLRDGDHRVAHVVPAAEGEGAAPEQDRAREDPAQRLDQQRVGEEGRGEHRDGARSEERRVGKEG